MGREVISKSDFNLAEGGNPPDEYADRLMKYLPGESVSVYLFVSGIIAANKGQFSLNTLTWILWIVFISLLVLTFFYLLKVQKVTKYQQLAITLLSFIIWVFTLGGPFALYSWYNPVYGAIFLPIYTFGIAIIDAKE